MSAPLTLTHALQCIFNPEFGGRTEHHSCGTGLASTHKGFFVVCAQVFEHVCLRCMSPGVEVHEFFDVMCMSMNIGAARYFASSQTSAQETLVCGCQQAVRFRLNFANAGFWCRHAHKTFLDMVHFNLVKSGISLSFLTNKDYQINHF